MTPGAARSSKAPRPRRWTLRRLALWSVCLLLGALVAGELGARWILGLGDPPLFILDPDIEYLLRPAQSVRRFGHDYRVNAHSMRSDDFATAKPTGQLRVMVIGDSIVNGGGKIDQADLATTLLRHDLAASLKRDVAVGNISAPSWGPANQLAYVRRFGLFDADLAVIVCNSDDYDDAPGLEYVGSAWPRAKPALALQELIGVYIRKAIHARLGWFPEPPPPTRIATHEQDIAACRAAFTGLITLCQQRGAKVIVVQFLKRNELTGPPQAGFTAMQAWSRQAGVEPVSSAALFTPAVQSGSSDPFAPADRTHPSATGQRLLSRLLSETIRNSLSDQEVTKPHPHP